ncbi:MAG: hypothetical protein GF335_04140 [Candidatus Moranbacteria bacterium]|nr:hypothetical protein [Candidatus Moranbacteria bacterium]
MQAKPQIKTSFSQKKANSSDDLAKNSQSESSDFFKQAEPTFKVEQPVEPKSININSPMKTKKQNNQNKDTVDLPVPPLGGGGLGGGSQDSAFDLNNQGHPSQRKTNDPDSSFEQTKPNPLTQQSKAEFQQPQPNNQPQASPKIQTPPNPQPQPQDQAQSQTVFSGSAKKPDNQEEPRLKENKEHLLEQQGQYNPELVEKQNKRLKKTIRLLVAFFVFLLMAFGGYYVYVYTDILKGFNVNYYLKFLGLE